MKILFICSGNAKEGISPIIYRQGQSLLKQDTISLDYFPVKGKGFGSYFKAISLVKKALQEKSYDVIHAHYALCGYVALFSKRKEKLVLSFMGDDLLGTNLSNGKTSYSSLLFAFINKRISKLFFNAIVVKSPEMLQKFGKNKKVTTIANGVDLDTFKPLNKSEAQQAVGFNKTKKHIIFVADPLRPEKNFSLAKQAIELLPKEVFELHTIYNSTTEKLVQYYNAADVLIMTSFHEGSPNVVKEAMSCNCPVICTKVGDVEELFFNTEGCYLTDYNAQNLSELIIKAVDFRKTKFFSSGRQKIKELKLDSDSVAEKMINLYKTLN